MKPIELTIQGLQSYREAQRIDFAALCEAGVFGIFGPTGSGKSTILDAVTLAMYGSVERAGSGIQGIMNASEDALSVAFTFELADGARRVRYRAERTYRRKADGTVEQRLARLSARLPGADWAVLADKAGEVTGAIEKLIGLSMTDFTRAVVLPQGKFAEFLGLKGKERREMLQRLFRLERYGDELGAKLAGRLNELKARLRETAAELQGLGDASPDAVALAEGELREAVSAEAEHLERQQAAEAALAETVKLWEWQQELSRLEAEAKRLRGQEAVAAEWERRLGAAEKADRLYPLWDAARQSAELAAKLSAEREGIDRAYAEAAEREQTARANRQATERALAEGEGPALVRLEQLRQAIALVSAVRSAEAVKHAADRRRDEALAARDAAAAALVQKQALRTKGMERQQTLKRELAEQDVPVELRRRTQAASQRLGEVRALQKQVQTARSAAADKRRAASDRFAAAAAAAAAERAAHETLAPLHARLRQAEEVLRRTEAELNRWDRALPETMRAIERSTQGDQAKQWAALLAAELHDGAPCPVCGSAEHPAKADASHAHAAGDFAQQISLLSELHADVRLTLEQARTAASQTNNSAVRLLERLGSSAQDSIESVSKLSASEAAAGRAEPQPSLKAAEWRAAYDLCVEAMQQAASAAQGLMVEAEREWKRSEEMRRRQEQLQAEANTAGAIAEEAEQTADGLERSASSELDAWQRAYPDWPLSSFEQFVRGLEAREETVRELRARLEKSETFLAELGEELESLQRNASEAERLLAQAEAEADGAASVWTEKSVELRRVVGEDNDPAAEAEALQARLTRWRTEESEAKAAEEQARAAVEELGRRLAAAAERAAFSQETAAADDALWSEALTVSVFTSVEAMLEARLAEEARGDMASRLREWKELSTQAEARADAVRERLDGRSANEAQWREAEQRHAAARAARESALEARAKAERRAEELLEKHAEWRRLKAEEEQVSVQIERLSKLQSVFRGNAFVEFLAEEQLYGVTRAASERLAQLTRGRYAIEVDSSGGFVIRDDLNGGTRRSVSTLSGGETFLTALSLALALSAQIQLSGKYPLEFFFLDEGFGTLDADLLDNVVTALERLQAERLAVGVISHVPELQQRLPRKLIVTPADPLGRGSRVRMETV